MNEKQNMKKKMHAIQRNILSELGDDASVLVATVKDGHCGAILKGSATEVAQSIFAIIYGEGSECSMNLYNIVKLLTLNILKNESPFSVDLANAILNVSDVKRECETDGNGENGKAKLIKLKQDWHDEN